MISGHMRYQFEDIDSNFQNQITRDFFSTPKKLAPRGAILGTPDIVVPRFQKFCYFFLNSPLKYLSELTIKKMGIGLLHREIIF